MEDSIRFFGSNSSPHRKFAQQKDTEATSVSFSYLYYRVLRRY